MLDPIVNFFTWVFQWIGRGIGFVVGIILWPFLWIGHWYAKKGCIQKTALGAVVLLVIGLYANFFYATQWWNGFNPDYVTSSTFPVAKSQAGDTSAGSPAVAPGAASGSSTTTAPAAGATTNTGTTAQAPASCNRSAIVDISAELV